MFDAGHVFECDGASRVSHDPYRSHRERQHEKNAMIDSRFHASKKRRSDFDVGNAGICVLICPYVQRDVTRILSPYNTTLPVHYAVWNVVNTSSYEVAARYSSACALKRCGVPDSQTGSVSMLRVQMCCLR